MRTSIEQRVARAAEAALQDHGYVAALDVLVGMGWLQPVHRDRWQQGRVPCLERVVQAAPGTVSTAMRGLSRWAREQGLQPSETAYVARTRDRRTLRFSVSGDPNIERLTALTGSPPPCRRPGAPASSSRPADRRTSSSSRR